MKMIFMAYKLITEMNLSKGLEVPFIYANEISSGLFMKVVLAMIWAVFCFGSYFIQKNKYGSASFPTSLAVAGFITIVSAVLLRLIVGLVDGLTLAVTIIIGTVSILYFLFHGE